MSLPAVLFQSVFTINNYKKNVIFTYLYVFSLDILYTFYWINNLSQNLTSTRSFAIIRRLKKEKGSVICYSIIILLDFGLYVCDRS